MTRSSPTRAWALAVATLVVPAACAGGDDPPSPSTSATAVTTLPGTPTTSPPSSGSPDMGATTDDAVRLIEVTYAGGQVAGGAQRTTVRLGEKVRLRVTSDVADEVHVHTYDVKAAVAPGQPAQLELVASIPGRHEVELEKKGRQLLILEVR